MKGRRKVETETLISKAKSGDDHAFYELITMNKEKLYKIAFSYLRDETDSLEAIQEVTYRAYTKLNKLKEPKFFSTWLIKILINYCTDELKRRKRTVFKPVEDHPTNELDKDARYDLEQAVDQLDTKYKTVIILKYYQDLTITDIAAILERPEGTIKTWLNKALKELRKGLREDGEFNYA